jgi:hypothetical protein
MRMSLGGRRGRSWHGWFARRGRVEGGITNGGTICIVHIASRYSVDSEEEVFERLVVVMVERVHKCVNFRSAIRGIFELGTRNVVLVELPEGVVGI